MSLFDRSEVEELIETNNFCRRCPLRKEGVCQYGEVGLIIQRNERDRVVVWCSTVREPRIVEKHKLHEPVNPCQACEKKRECDQLPGDVSWKCKKNRDYILAMEKFYLTPMGYTPPEQIRCSSCAMYFYNRFPQYVRRAKTVRREDTFCHLSKCRIGVRAMRKHNFPVWCLRVRDKESCLYCGTAVFYDEGGVCPKCEREQKSRQRGN